MANVGESVLTGGEAILLRVQRHAAGIGPVDGLGAPTVLRQRARDAVLEYRIAGQAPIIATCCAEAADVITAERALHVLASHGFDAPARMRVPAVVGCFQDRRVLLMRRADGVPLPTLVHRAADWVQGVRAAGRWLAQLYLLESRDAPRLAAEAVAERLARRAGRAAARRPESADALSEHLATVLARSGGGSTESTLTHGRFHPGHVFVDRASVTVIDLDGLAVADPARDLGEFLGRLAIVARRTRQDDRAHEEAVAAFVAGYREAGGAIPGSLAFHWSATLLGIMAHVIETGHRRLARRIDHCAAELRMIPDRAAAIMSDANAGRR